VENEAVVVLDGQGRVVGATPPALDIFGLPLESLLGVPAQALTASSRDREEQAALDAALEGTRPPQIAGQTTIKRPNGTKVHVSYLVTPRPDGSWVAILKPIAGANDQSSVYTVGGVLAAWRAAERRLEAVTPGSPEAASIAEEVADLRDRYQAIFRSVQ
jgi:PAS domain S-box-containing protein